MKVPLRFWFSVVILIVLFTGACGYRYGGIIENSKVLGENSIRMGKFQNETPYSRVGIILGEKIKDVLVANGYSGKFDGNANYVIRGNVHNLQERPVGFSEERFGLEYEVSCQVSVEVIQTGTGETLLNLKNFLDTSTYYSGQDPSYTRTNREKAVEFVLEKISIRFVDLLKEI